MRTATYIVAIALLTTSAVAQEPTKSETLFLPTAESCKSVCELAKNGSLAEPPPDPAHQKKYFTCFMKRLCTAGNPFGLPLAKHDPGSLGLPVPTFHFIEKFVTGNDEIKG